MSMRDDNATIKSRSIISILSLFFQSGYSAILGLLANLFLTILLSPAIFGVYITVLSLISLLNYFSDIGLAASLIQRKEIDDDDIKTAFTIQQCLVISAVSVGLIMTNFIVNFYNLPRQGVYLYWALLTGFFLSSLKTIPSVFLERKIQYQKIVLVQIMENTVFYLSVIGLAFAGYGLMSFAYAVLLRATVGLIAIYKISYWMPRIGVSRKSIKHLLSFGIPFQSISFLAIFKDDLIYLFLGKVLGFEALGYIGWAKKWGESTLRIIMDNLSKVLFPLLSRYQSDKQKIRVIVEKMLYYQTLLLAPSSMGLALIMNYLIIFIPKYGKWLPALPFFYIFCLSAFLSSYSTPFISMFNALAKVRTSLKFMTFWTVSTWLFTVSLTKFYGNFGFPMTSLLLSSTFIFVVFAAKKVVNFSFLPTITPAIISSIIMVFVFRMMLFIMPVNVINLGLLVILSGMSYYLSLRIIFRINLLTEVRNILFYGKN